jgi:anti-sigma B factor antagonist
VSDALKPMSADLAEIAVSKDGDTTIAAISGELDESNADDVAQALVDLAGSDGRRLVVDLSGVEFIGSAGIRALFSLMTTACAKEGHLRVVVPEDSMTRRVLLMVEAQRLMELDATLDVAIASLSRDGKAV